MKDKKENRQASSSTTKPQEEKHKEKKPRHNSLLTASEKQFPKSQNRKRQKNKASEGDAGVLSRENGMLLIISTPGDTKSKNSQIAFLGKETDQVRSTGADWG